jgi:hypothetical protein
MKSIENQLTRHLMNLRKDTGSYVIFAKESHIGLRNLMDYIKAERMGRRVKFGPGTRLLLETFLRGKGVKV